jgi:polyisoprenoid-binding protein YceI
MKKAILPFTYFISLIIFSGIAHAEPAEWQIDRVHSGVYFEIRHSFATVRGQFDDISGKLVFDPENMSASRCDLEVKVASVNTNNKQRDDHLRTKEFFSVDEYQAMKFQTTRVNSTQDNQFQLMGKLTIKDVTQEVTVPMTYLGVKENPFNPKQLVSGFEASFKIDRLAYHVGTGKFYKMGALGKDVTITVSIEALKDK